MNEDIEKCEKLFEQIARLCCAEEFFVSKHELLKAISKDATEGYSIIKKIEHALHHASKQRCHVCNNLGYTARYCHNCGREVNPPPRTTKRCGLDINDIGYNTESTGDGKPAVCYPKR